MHAIGHNLKISATINQDEALPPPLRLHRLRCGRRPGKFGRFDVVLRLHFTSPTHIISHASLAHLQTANLRATPTLREDPSGEDDPLAECYVDCNDEYIDDDRTKDIQKKLDECYAGCDEESPYARSLGEEDTDELTSVSLIFDV